MSAVSTRIVPVILCGGAGMRLWPLSRLDRPKPFVSLDGGETLLELTARRVADPALFAAPIVVVSAEYGALAGDQVALSGQAGGRLILEPCGRGTAAAIALAALVAAPEDLLLVLPSDHVVKDEAAFHAAVAAGEPAARAGALVTFGVRPDRPETGYGYIESGERTATGVRKVARFVEKPDAATAARYVASGDHLWNAGIFLFRAGDLLDALRAHAPYILPAVEAALAERDGKSALIRPDAAAFARAPAQSIDHAVMEKSDRVAVVPVEMGWSDVGSWEALHAVADKDADANVRTGDVVLIDSEGSLARSDGPLVVGVGLRDMVVVATERAVLIVPRGDSQRVKEAVEVLIRRGEKTPKDILEA